MNWVIRDATLPTTADTGGALYLPFPNTLTNIIQPFPASTFSSTTFVGDDSQDSLQYAGDICPPNSGNIESIDEALSKVDAQQSIHTDFEPIAFYNMVSEPEPLRIGASPELSSEDSHMAPSNENLDTSHCAYPTISVSPPITDIYLEDERREDCNSFLAERRLGHASRPR